MSFIKNLFSKKNQRQEVVADFQTTIIRVDDNYISSSSIKLDEMLAGNIYSLKEVVVSASAEISGNITSTSASVGGIVKGNIVCLEALEIKNTAVITGHILTKTISVEAGAIVNGSIRIEGDIDDRDLKRKIESRIPAQAALKEPVFVPQMLPEPAPKEVQPKPEIRPAETSKRTPVQPAAKQKQLTIEEATPEVGPATPNSWY